MRMVQLLSRRCASVPIVRSLRNNQSVDAVFQAFRHGMHVERSVTFAARDLLRRPGAYRYRLSGSDVAVSIRHNQHDSWILHEIFGERSYAMPPDVKAAVSSTSARIRVVDLGGNIGLFGAYILQLLPTAHLVSFEREPSNAARLRECIELNRWERRWELVEACACVADGGLNFVTGLHGDSHEATLNDGSPTAVLPAVDVFPYLGDADLVKMDIEGGEWALLADERLAEIRPKTIVLEYHPRLCPNVRPGLDRHGAPPSPRLPRPPGPGGLAHCRDRHALGTVRLAGMGLRARRC